MRLLAIDGNSILNRAFYGIRLLSNQKGIYTNAIFGFMNIYFKHVSEVKPDRIVTAFDLKAPTFRHKAVDTYKANRKGMPEELAMQLPYIKEILTLMGVPVVTCEGYEADDILGTLSRICTEQGSECHIVTGDRDSLQLVDENVTVRLVTNKDTISYTPEKFTEEYGFPPLSMIDLKALMGDSSDNISGVAGIGQKTASGLIQKWTTIENLYENIDNAGLTKGVYNKLTTGKEAAEQSKWLATIVKDAPIPDKLSDYDKAEQQGGKLRTLLLDLEMAKLISKLDLDGTSAAEETETENAPAAPEITFEEKTLTADVITEWENAGITVCYLFDGSILTAFVNDTVYITEDTSIITAFLSGSIKKRTFSAKPHYRYCLENGCELKNLITDGEICAYILNPTTSEYTIDRLCVTYHIAYPNGKYADISVLNALCDAMERLADEQDQTELYKMELRLTEVLASMEHTGVRTDKKGVKEFGVYLSEQIEEMQQLVYDEAGHQFKIGSPKQLGEVLFSEMGLPHGKKTKTGYSTNAEILESLRDEYKIVDYVLKWRQFSKLKSTYVDGLLKTVGKDGRIHSVFKQTETRTGRISSTEPNMQNIPVRTSLGRNMRKFFLAEDGNILLDADYSQIELRILANLCGDENMQAAFLSGEDIHTATAAQVFGMPTEMVTSEMRSAAKAVNFGIIYGIGAFSLSKDIGVSVYEANRYIKNYLARYPKVNEFMEQIVENCKADGYVSTYFKRRRPVPELRQSNKMVQAAGKRIAMNTPIQGTAADIIKMAMVKVYDRLRSEVPEARLILQVHDELIVEVPQKLALKAAKILGETMQTVVDFTVPLTAEVNMGGSWYDAKG
ncbi:MAG: DNA polymerase I [Ruminococcus sp.]|nr:DNA polymerase I [Ruminococcus sp.]